MGFGGTFGVYASKATIDMATALFTKDAKVQRIIECLQTQAGMHSIWQADREPTHFAGTL